MNLTIDGVEEINNILRKMRQSGARKVNIAGGKLAAKVLVKAARSEVPPNYKKAKMGIGSKVLKAREAPDGGVKVGSKVGRSGKKARSQMASLRKKKRGRPGVGFSGANVHWLFLGGGTRGDRYTGKEGGPKRRTGRFKVVMRAMTSIAMSQKGAMLAAYKKGAYKKFIGLVKEGKAF